MVLYGLFADGQAALAGRLHKYAGCQLDLGNNSSTYELVKVTKRCVVEPALSSGKWPLPVNRTAYGQTRSKS